MCVQLMSEQEHLLLLVACVHEKLMILKPSLPVVLFRVMYRKKEKPVYVLLWFTKLDDGQRSECLSKCCYLFHCFTVHFNSLCVMVPLMHLFVIKH
jgi:hypothetical protein